MSMNADILAAWEAARSVGGESVTFHQAGDVFYDESIGENSPTSGSVTTVQAIVSRLKVAGEYMHDQAAEGLTVVVQTKDADLPREARIGEKVVFEGNDYWIKATVRFQFGVTESKLEGARS